MKWAADARRCRNSAGLLLPGPRQAGFARGVNRENRGLPLEDRLQPQCRMPDYAASAVATSAFNIILLGTIRPSFAHVSKSRATTQGQFP